MKEVRVIFKKDYMEIKEENKHSILFKLLWYSLSSLKTESKIS